MKFLPDLKENFGYSDAQIKYKDDRADLKFKGGEYRGWKRMNEYLFGKFQEVIHYAKTKNELQGKDN